MIARTLAALTAWTALVGVTLAVMFTVPTWTTDGQLAAYLLIGPAVFLAGWALMPEHDKPTPRQQEAP